MKRKKIWTNNVCQTKIVKTKIVDVMLNRLESRKMKEIIEVPLPHLYGMKPKPSIIINFLVTSIFKVITAPILLDLITAPIRLDMWSIA